METTETKHIKKARKSYRCDWCYELIERGSSYSAWFTFGENVTARMHPECYTAMLKADLYDEELPPPATFRRGCWCGENEEFCKCNKKENENG